MLKISTAQRRITPEGEFFPCYLLGHAIRTEKATGILNDIYASAILLEFEDKKSIWISLELAGCDREESDKLRQTLMDKYGVPKENIFISFTHTHAAPEYSDISPFFGAERAQVPGYWDFIARQIMDSVEECFSKELVEVEAFAKVTEIEGYYCNRNGFDKPCDKQLITVEFRNGEQVVAGIVNFACHPTVLGPQNLEVDGDLAGYISRSLKEKWGVYAFVMQGAAGDMGNRLYRQGNDAAELKRIGEGIMEQVYANTSEIKLKINNLDVRTYHYFDEWDIDTETLQQQLADIEEKLANAKNFDETKVYTSAKAVLQAKMKKNHDYIDLECQYIQMGDLSIFTMPAELFSRFGLEIKNALGTKCSLFWGYNNYSVGYLFNEEDAGASFESAASSLPLGSTERITSEIVGFIQREKIMKPVITEVPVSDSVGEFKWPKPKLKYKKTLIISIILFIGIAYTQFKERGIEAFQSSGSYLMGILVWACIFLVIWRGAVGFVMVITDKRTAENEEQIQKVNQFHKEYDLFTYKNANKIYRDLKRKKKG